jgi:hypothetical protein
MLFKVYIIKSKIYCQIRVVLVERKIGYGY